VLNECFISVIINMGSLFSNTKKCYCGVEYLKTEKEEHFYTDKHTEYVKYVVDYVKEHGVADSRWLIMSAG
jgi:archaellum component FlaF (FlaF/FlaG flagellin family)